MVHIDTTVWSFACQNLSSKVVEIVVVYQFLRMHIDAILFLFDVCWQTPETDLCDSKSINWCNRDGIT